MRALRTWAREHVLAVDSLIALAFFALGLLSVRIYYDIGTAAPHNFRFATAVAFTALLTLPLAVRRLFPPVPLICVTIAVTGGRRKSRIPRCAHGNGGWNGVD